MQFSSIFTLTLNPAIDATLYLDELTPGAENPVLREHYEAAGKGTNVSRGLLANGISNCTAVVVGSGNRERYLAELRPVQSDLLVLEVPGSIRENLTLMLPGQPATRLMRKGITLTKADVERVRDALLPLCGPGVLAALCGKLPCGMSREEFVSLAVCLREAGASLVVDTSSLDRASMLEIRPWLIKPNRAELEQLMERSLPDDEAVLSASRELCAGGVGWVLASLDGDGMICCSREEAWRVRVPEIRVVSAVGAGDNLLARFLSCRQKKLPMERCLREACAAGTASCLEAGTRPPREDRVLELIGKTTAVRME